MNRISDAKIKRIRELFLSGVGHRRIAEEVGISPTAVRRWTRDLREAAFVDCEIKPQPPDCCDYCGRKLEEKRRAFNRADKQHCERKFCNAACFHNYLRKTRIGKVCELCKERPATTFVDFCLCYNCRSYYSRYGKDRERVEMHNLLMKLRKELANGKEN